MLLDDNDENGNLFFIAANDELEKALYYTLHENYQSVLAMYKTDDLNVSRLRDNILSDKNQSNRPQSVSTMAHAYNPSTLGG